MIQDIPYPVLSENELETIFQIDGKIIFKSFLIHSRYIFVSIVLVLIIFAIGNFSAIMSNLTYKRSKTIIPPEKRALALNLTQPKNDTETDPESNPTDSEEQSSPLENQKTMKENYLQITSLGIQAPINWNTEFEVNAIQKNLETGIVQLKGTALAGQSGNQVITGHSSYFPWAKGNYKSIFARLPKIKLGDQIYISRDNVTYTYEVKNIFEVTPEKMEVVELGDKTMLTLITCTPVGTATRRLIIQANQINPDPSQNRPFSGEPIKIQGEIPR